MGYQSLINDLLGKNIGRVRSAYGTADPIDNEALAPPQV
jgi:hypothetical protein